MKICNIAFAAAGLGALLCSLGAGAQTHTGRFIDPLVTMGSACSDDVSCNLEAEKYLQAIGVYTPQAGSTTGTADRGTSTAWKTTMGFSTTKGILNPGEMRAVYWNAGDLGLGRDMHCIIKKVTGGLFGLKSQTFACYVTNYREPTTTANPFTVTPDIPNSIADAANNTKALATVAMEQTYTYPRLISAAPPPINFIAFDEVNGSRPFSPVLDSNTGYSAPLTQNPQLHPGKASPGTCISCHGGTYHGSTEPGGARVEGANFLPFNTDDTNFSYTTDPGLSQFFESAQREAFRQLNQFVLQAGPAVPTISDLVNGWYAWCGGVANPGCYINSSQFPFIPDVPSDNSACATTSPGLQRQTCGWLHGQPVNPPEKPASLTAHVYQNVAGVYCRTCHVALPGLKNVEQFNDWMAPSGSPEVQAVVAGYLMPFAEVPFNRFWHDPLAQAQFGSFFNPKPSACVNSCDAAGSQCGIQCNVAEGACMAQAHTAVERQQCIREQSSCTASCSSTRGSCVNACSY